MHYLVVFALAVIVIAFVKRYLRNKDDKSAIASPNDTLNESYNAKKKTEQLEIDKILEKVSENGLHSLSKSDREKLDNYKG